jgi:hypothetical protein
MNSLFRLVELPASWFPAEWKGNPWTLPGRWCLLPVAKR